MNSSQQAKKGLKTFTFALVVSLGVFAIFYYLTSYPTEAVDIEKHSEKQEEALLDQARKDSFEKLAKETPITPSRSVLGGADVAETTQSTSSVPTTGISNITIAFAAATIIFVAGGYIIYLNPRTLALSHFEKKFFN